MGRECIVYGYIYGSPWHSNDYRKFQDINRTVIENMSSTDDWPFLTRSMFSIPGPAVEEGTYQGQLIHFGATMKDLEQDWPRWLEKFEALLRQLYWFEAVVHLELELGGNHKCVWGSNQLADDPPRPTSKWDFNGPREFDQSNLKPVREEK